MIEIEVSAGNARLLQSETLTAGRVGLVCRLRFDPAWSGLQKTAVLAGSRCVDLFLTGTEFCIPPECLERAGDTLRIGLYGLNGDGSLVIPTVWVNCGEIRAGTSLSGNAQQEATENLLAQVMRCAEDARATAERIQNAADRGAFVGPRGPQGPQGEIGPQGPAGVIEDGSVTTEKLADYAVSNEKLAYDAVGPMNIRDAAVTKDKILAAAVTTSKLKDGAVTGAKLADGAVTGYKIVDGNISTAKLANGAVTAAKLAPGLIPNGGAVAADQGSANAGKFLVVGTNGLVTPVTMTAWTGGSY